jgi:tetratricopeptide (TPR) repeat protein
MAEDIQQQILDELRSQTVMFGKANKTNIKALCIFVVVTALFIASAALIPHISRRPSISPPRLDSWQEVRSLWDQGESDKANEMLNKLLKKYPKYWYGYALLGSFHQELGNFKEAEEAYAKAYDLFPSEENRKILDAIRVVSREDATANK